MADKSMPPDYNAQQPGGYPSNAPPGGYPGNAPPGGYPGGYPDQAPPGAYPGQPYHGGAGYSAGGGQTTVMMAQPMAPIIIQQAPPPVDRHKYLGFAIFVTICCNLVFGIIAIIFAVLNEGGPEHKTYGIVTLVMCIIALLSGFAIWGFLLYYIIFFAILVGSAAAG